MAAGWEEDDGATVAWVVVRGKLAGLLAARDRERQTASEAIALLRDLSVKTVMLTGDNAGAARRIADRIGLTVESRRTLRSYYLFSPTTD